MLTMMRLTIRSCGGVGGCEHYCIVYTTLVLFSDPVLVINVTHRCNAEMESTDEGGSSDVPHV